MSYFICVSIWGPVVVCGYLMLLPGHICRSQCDRYRLGMILIRSREIACLCSRPSGELNMLKLWAWLSELIGQHMLLRSTAMWTPWSLCILTRNSELELCLEMPSSGISSFQEVLPLPTSSIEDEGLYYFLALISLRKLLAEVIETIGFKCASYFLFALDLFMAKIHHSRSCNLRPNRCCRASKSVVHLVQPFAKVTSVPPRRITAVWFTKGTLARPILGTHRFYLLAIPAGKHRRHFE